MLDVDILFMYLKKRIVGTSLIAFNIFKPMRILESWPAMVFWGVKGRLRYLHEFLMKQTIYLAAVETPW